MERILGSKIRDFVGRIQVNQRRHKDATNRLCSHVAYYNEVNSVYS